MARLARNSLLCQALEQLQGRIALVLQLYRHDYDPHVYCLQDDHEKFIAFVEAGKVDEALSLLHRHLGTVETSLNIDNEEISSSDNLELLRALELVGARKA